MPKKTTDFPEQINLLCPEDTTIMLVSIAYYRGDGGKYAGPARDFILTGIRNWIEALAPKDRKRFDEILANVKIMRGNLPV